MVPREVDLESREAIVWFGDVGGEEGFTYGDEC